MNLNALKIFCFCVFGLTQTSLLCQLKGTKLHLNLDTLDFIDGYAEVDNNGKHGFINANGIALCDFVYNGTWNWREGLGGVKLDELWGAIDATGELVFPIAYDLPLFFMDGVSGAAMNGKYGLIDKNQRMLIPIIYDGIGILKRTKNSTLIPVRKEDKWGLADMSNGNLLVPAIYDLVLRVVGGGFHVIKNDKDGLIDYEGNLIIPCIYNSIGGFFGSWCEVLLDGKYGYCDKNGNLVVPCIYDKVKSEWTDETRTELHHFGLLDGKWIQLN